MKKILSIALCLSFVFFLVGCGVKSSDIPDNMDYDGINLISYPRDVKVDGAIIDTARLIYEENPASFIGENGSHTLQIYITTDFIKKYIDPKTKYSDGEFTFKINNNLVKLTENNVKVENELFGTIYECEITAFYYNKVLIVNSSDISEIIGESFLSHHRKNDNDNYMMTEHLEFITNRIGELYTNSTYDASYDYYTKGFEREKPNGEVIGVNLRGNYIYQNENGECFIEANDVYYPIYTELAFNGD